MSEDPSLRDEAADSSQFVQAGHISGGVHFHARAPDRPLLDLWLILAGALMAVAGLGAGVLILMSFQDSALPPVIGTGIIDLVVRPGHPPTPQIVVVGYCGLSLLWAALDMFSRQDQTRGRDRLAGRTGFWLSFIPVCGALSFASELPRMWVALFVPATLASTIAAARTLSGDFRRRWGIAIAAGTAATAWYVPEVSLLWTLDRGPYAWRLAGTVLLLGIIAVPVLATLTGPAERGAAVLRGWCWGLTAKLVLTVTVLTTTEVGPHSTMIPKLAGNAVLLSLAAPACALVAMLTTAAILSDRDTRHR